MSILAQDATGSEPCGGGADFLCDWVFDITDSERIAEIADWVVERPLKVIVIFVVAYILNRVVRRGIDRFVARLVADREERRLERERDEIDDGRFDAFRQKAIRKARMLAQSEERSKQRAQTLGTVMRSIATAVIYSIAILISLAEFDINLAPLIAGAGIAGIALGFGAQSIVRDFLSGIFMLVEDQYGVGDIVDVGEATGVVEEVTLRTTRLRDVTGTVWYFPNGEILRVANMSQQWARAVLDVEVAYDTDIDQATGIIKEAADTLWRDKLEEATILEEPEIWGVQALGESSVAIRLVVKTEPGEQDPEDDEKPRERVHEPRLDQRSASLPARLAHRPECTARRRPDRSPAERARSSVARCSRGRARG